MNIFSWFIFKVCIYMFYVMYGMGVNGLIDIIEYCYVGRWKNVFYVSYLKW